MKDMESTWSHRDGSLVSGSYNPAGGVEPEQQWGLYSLKEFTGLLDWPALLGLCVSIPFRWACQIADMKDKLIAWVSGYHLGECI